MRTGSFGGKACGVAAAIVSTLIASDAEAGCSCGGVRGIVKAAHSETRETVNAHTTAVGNAITEAFLRGVAQLSAYEERATEAAARIEDASQQLHTVRARQLARAKAEGGAYDPAVSACVALTGISFGGLSQAPPAAAATGQDVANAVRNRARAVEEDSPVRIGGARLEENRLDIRDTSAGLLGVLDPTSDARAVLGNQTIDTRSPDEAVALAAFVSNVVDPTPPRPLTGEEASTVDGVTRIGEDHVRQSRLSVAHAAIAHLIDQRTPQANGAELANWAREAAPTSYMTPIPDVVSEHQYLDIEVASRFPNPEWHAQVSQMSPEAVQREALLLEGLRLYLDWKRYQLEQNGVFVDAAQLALLTELDQENEP